MRPFQVRHLLFFPFIAALRPTLSGDPLNYTHDGTREKVLLAYSNLTLRISSSCWDLIAEVTAFAVNFTPTAALRNTCAGINQLHIFKLPVRILAVRDDEGKDEHLEHVFGGVEKKKARG